ncbi:MAG: accessory factor UbiK family protein [Casimicrobiaceae bacterium]
MTLDELVAQLREIAASSPGDELQKNFRATLAAGLARMDVVTRQEFDIQRALLDALRERVDVLTRQIEALEAERRGKGDGGGGR